MRLYPINPDSPVTDEALGTPFALAGEPNGRT
jgi:hypothetical protein